MEMETNDDEDADIRSTTEEDLATLPIIDRGLSFGDSLFDPPCLAQMMTMIVDDIITEVFHDAILDL